MIMIGLLGWQGKHNYVSDIVGFTFETIIAMQTFTRWGASWRLSWYLGSWSLLIIHGWRRTWAAVSLLWGSTWSIFDTRSYQQRSLKIKGQTDRTYIWLSVLNKSRACNLCLKWYRIPVSTSQGKFPTANPSQNFFRCIFRAISKWSEPEGRTRVVNFETDMNIVFELNHARLLIFLNVTFGVLQKLKCRIKSLDSWTCIVS